MKVVKIVAAAAMMLSLAIAPINVFADQHQNPKEATITGNGMEQAGKATVSKFSLYGNDLLHAYNEKFKLANDNIASITNNGRNYSGSPIENAIDGDMNTHWETNKENSKTFENDVTINFNETTLISRIVYAARQDGAKGKGFAQEFDIYGSTTDKGNDFTKVSTGEYKGSTGDIVEIKFKPTEFKRLKFVFKKADQGWASASEFQFYKEDQTADKMDRLFTDKTLSTVSKEFNTVEALEELEKEVKGHILYPIFKEDVQDAKEIVAGEEIKSTVAATKLFNDFNNKGYTEQFKMGNENIRSIKANTGQYQQQVIANAIDGKLETYWETNRDISGKFFHEIEVEFEEAMKLNRLVYGARADRKGFAEEFEIYASQTSKGDTYQLLSTGGHATVGGLVEAKFEPTKIKRVKFKFKRASQNWATLSEIAFYKEDVISQQVESIFTDGTMSELLPEYRNLDAINELDTKAKNHPLYTTIKEQLELAKNLIENPDELKGSVFSLESRGDSVQESRKRRVWNFKDWQPTGLAAKSGQVINVYVDVETGKPTPKLVFKQMDTRNDGAVEIPLSKGMNKITIPTLQDSEMRPGTAKAGVIYTLNPYTPEQQGSEPKVRIVGAQSYPHFIKGEDTDAEVLKELEEYVGLLKTDSAMTNAFEVFSDKGLVTVEATYAHKWFKDNNALPSETADRTDEALRETMKFWGFDGSTEKNSDFNFRYVTMFKHLPGGVFMNAANGVTAVHADSQSIALGAGMGWGTAHEMGHNFDTRNKMIPETTNNILPLHFQKINGEATKITEQDLWEKNILPKVALEDYSKNEHFPKTDVSLLSHIAPLWQLQLYDETFYPKYEQVFRNGDFSSGGDMNKIHREWVKVSSDILQLDLFEHFERHGLRAGEDVKNYTSKYPKPDKKLWYINDKIYLDNGGKFTEDVEYTAKLNSKSKQVALSFEMDKENVKNTLGFEILRDGEVIGFTATNSFVDKTATSGIDYVYEVVAYDKELNATKSVEINAFTPSLSVENNVTLKMHSEFEPMDYVKASSHKGEDITKDVTIKSNNVDVTKKGNYEVVYKVKNAGLVETKTTNVVVTSDYKYISELPVKSSKVGWGSLQKDKSVNGGKITLIRQGLDVTYAKGIGAHAHSEVVYDIEGQGFENFESYIGIDQSMRGTSASANFEVWVDGEKKYSSKVFTADTSHEFVQVPVSGAKEVKLITTEATHGNASDHTVWADAKFTNDNAKPQLTIPKSSATKVGTPIDLNEKYSAFDVEDGDLTSSVKVSGVENVNFNRVGKYEITYTVIDSDGNEVTETRTVSVVNMDDYHYLSDFNWKSTQNSYTAPKKDVSIESNTLRLTGADGKEVAYKKGIGAHSNSTIVYDLTDKDAEFFTSFVGVDRQMYGTAGSVSFEVYVDGEKQFDSGLMNSKDPQQFVDVNIGGAKELKLVVTDGGNGNGSDHATWGDAKLHFANADRIFTQDLEAAIEEAKAINTEDYTSESVVALQASIAPAEELLTNKQSTQADIDQAVEMLKQAKDALVVIDLSQVITVPDKDLSMFIKQTLGITGEITLGNMYNLTSLSAFGTRTERVASLEGLQYAKNLVTLDISGNEVTDFSPLQGLEKLENLQADSQYIEIPSPTGQDAIFNVQNLVKGLDGKHVKPTQIALRHNRTFEEVVINVDQLEVNATQFSIDLTKEDKGYYTLVMVYEVEGNSIQIISIINHN